MSQIAEIDVVSLEYSVAPALAYGTARGLNSKRSSSLVKLTTSDGIVGYGETAGPTTIIRCYLELIKPYFVGNRLHDFEMIAAYVRNRLDHYGEGHYMACMSAINVAALDAIGKTHGVPVHDLIGGRSAERVPCYATTGYITRDGMAGLERQLATVDTKRFTGVKIKIGVNPRSDLERVRLARQFLGEDILLMVDVNANYTADIALESIRAIEPYNIHWYEEPLPSSDIAGHVELRARSPIAIATGEGLFGIHSFKALIEARAIDILQPAVAKCGGLSQAKAIAALALDANIRLIPAVWGGAYLMAASLHYIASLPLSPHTENVPYPRMLEFDIGENPLRDRLVTNPLVPEAGGVLLPTGPGLGLNLDQTVVDEFKVA